MRLAFVLALTVATLLTVARADAAPCSGRPTDAAGYQGYAYGAAEVKTFDGPRARVHYALTGSHAPQLATTRGDLVPDSVALAGDVAETALSRYAEMGFKTPPSDGSDGVRPLLRMRAGLDL